MKILGTVSHPLLFTIMWTRSGTCPFWDWSCDQTKSFVDWQVPSIMTGYTYHSYQTTLAAYKWLSSYRHACHPLFHSPKKKKTNWFIKAKLLPRLYDVRRKMMRWWWTQIIPHLWKLGSVRRICSLASYASVWQRPLCKDSQNMPGG